MIWHDLDYTWVYCPTLEYLSCLNQVFENFWKIVIINQFLTIFTAGLHISYLISTTILLDLRLSFHFDCKNLPIFSAFFLLDKMFDKYDSSFIISLHYIRFSCFRFSSCIIKSEIFHFFLAQGWYFDYFFCFLFHWAQARN